MIIDAVELTNNSSTDIYVMLYTMMAYNVIYIQCYIQCNHPAGEGPMRLEQASKYTMIAAVFARVVPGAEAWDMGYTIIQRTSVTLDIRLYMCLLCFLKLSF